MTAWTEIFEVSFQRFERESEKKLWNEELKHLVNGFRDIDPARMNDQICKSLRWASVQDVKPRSDSKRPMSRYTVADVALWVRIWRSNTGHDAANAQKRQNKSGAGLAYADVACKWIDWYLTQNRRTTAALVALDPSCETEVCNAIGVNRGPNPAETNAIRAHCNDIGFDPEMELRLCVDNG